MTTIESRMFHMTPKNTKSAFLATRVSRAVKEQFDVKCIDYGLTESELLRELVAALVEGRLTIKPPVNVKGNLYVS